MKKLYALILLMAICGFSACEQVNPLAETATGTNVQVTQGDPAAGEEDDDDDDNDDDDN